MAAIEKFVIFKFFASLVDVGFGAGPAEVGMAGGVAKVIIVLPPTLDRGCGPLIKFADIIYT